MKAMERKSQEVWDGVYIFFITAGAVALCGLQETAEEAIREGMRAVMLLCSLGAIMAAIRRIEGLFQGRDKEIEGTADTKRSDTDKEDKEEGQGNE